MNATMTRHAGSEDAAATTAPTMTGHEAERGTVFATGDGLADACTHEGLRAALGAIDVHGWESAAGRAVIAALADRSARWAACRALASRVTGRGVEAGEVLSVAWCTLSRLSGYVAVADLPWAYLWTCVQKSLAVDLAAGEALSGLAIQGSSSSWPGGAVRVGIHYDAFEVDPGLRHGDDDGAGAVSPAVAALIAHLSGGGEVEVAFWTDAVTRALDIVADARRTYELVLLRRDPYLRETLGLTADELSALGALLLGPRRAEPGVDSFLLALHRDPDTDPGAVVGAEDRIRALTARRQAADASPRVGPVVVAA